MDFLPAGIYWCLPGYIGKYIPAAYVVKVVIMWNLRPQGKKYVCRKCLRFTLSRILTVNHILCYIFQANLFQVSISSNIVQAIYFLLHLFEQNSCTNIFSATPVSCIFSHQHSFIYFVLQVCQPLFSCCIFPVWVLSCHVPISDWTKRSSCHNWSIWMASLPCEYSHDP